MKLRNLAFIVVGMLVLSNLVAAQGALVTAQSKICLVLQSVYELLLYLASGIGALMIVVMGITWITSADNAKARTSAKVAVVHVLIGLIIVSLALVLVAMVLPQGSDCVVGWPGWPS